MEKILRQFSYLNDEQYGLICKLAFLYVDGMKFEEWRYTAEDIRDHALRERDRLTKENKPFDIVKYKADINFIK